MPPTADQVAQRLRTAATRVREWFQRRLDEQSLDIARLYAAERDRFLARIGQIYQAYLDADPTIMAARRGPAGLLLDQAIAETTAALGDELGRSAVSHLSTVLDATPAQVAKHYSAWSQLAFDDLPETSQRALRELTTSVVGGGTFFDRVFNVTANLQGDITKTIRSGLINGDDFMTIRSRMMKVFGVDKLADPKGVAYGSVRTYRNAAASAFSDLMRDVGEESGGTPIWWATLDNATTPGCAARHGRRISDVGSPGRHYNCRCTVAIVERGADLSEFRADADAWLADAGYTRRQAGQMESWREAFDPAQPRAGAGSPDGGQWTSGGSGGEGGGAGDDRGAGTPSRGGDALSAHLAEPIEAFERAHARADRESARAVLPDGSVLIDKQGAENYVQFSPDEMARMRDRDIVFTHNHPLGVSFSRDDMLISQALNLREVRAVTAAGVYRMRRGPEGWFESRGHLEVELNKVEDGVTAEFWAKIAAKTMTIPQAMATHHDTVWRRLAVAYPEHLLYSFEEGHHARDTGRRLEARRQLSADLREAFNPDQPRVPAGAPEGGQWGSGGSGGGFASAPAAAFVAARNKSARTGYLSPLTPADLQGRQSFLNAAGTVGYVLNDGDIENLFNNGGPKGAGREAIFDALDQGGRTLDCFDGYLPDLYTQFGFAETGRMRFNRAYAPAGWDYAKNDDPDVVFMAWRGLPAARDVVRATLNGDRRGWLAGHESNRYYDDYDAAKADSRGAVDPRPGRATEGSGLDGSTRRADSGAGQERRRAVAAPVWGWGRWRLLPLYHVPPERRTEAQAHRYQARPWSHLPALAAGDQRGDWSTERQAFSSGGPDHVLVRRPRAESDRSFEVRAAEGWVPVVPTTGREVWIPTPMGRALDGPDGAHWQERAQRPPLDVIAAWPGLREVTIHGNYGQSWLVAVVGPEEAEAIVLGEAWDPALHPRVPKGNPTTGGRFTSGGGGGAGGGGSARPPGEGEKVFDASGGNWQNTPRGGRIALYRAAKPDGAHFGQWSAWSPERDVADAYRDNPGFGGSTLYTAAVDPQHVLDLSRDRGDFGALARALYDDPAEASAKVKEWRDLGYTYVYEAWENDKRGDVGTRLTDAYSWVVYKDDFPHRLGPPYPETWVSLEPDPVAAKKLPGGRRAEARDFGALVREALMAQPPQDPHLVIETEAGLEAVISCTTGRFLYTREVFEGLAAPYQRAAVAVFEGEGLVWAIKPRPPVARNGPITWVLPGGHISDGERPVDAALRELAEETGVTAIRPRFLGRLYQPWATTHMFVAERLGEPELPTTPEETDGIQVVSLDDLDPAERAFLLRHARGLRPTGLSVTPVGAR